MVARRWRAWVRSGAGAGCCAAAIDETMRARWRRRFIAASAVLVAEVSFASYKRILAAAVSCDLIGKGL